MSKQKGMITPIVIVVIVIGLLYYGYTYYGCRNSNTESTNSTNGTVSTNMPVINGNEGSETPSVPEMVVVNNNLISLGKDGFSPASITIKVGEKVTFKNDGTGQMWVASAPHPAHTNYPEFDEKVGVGNDQSYEFIFTKAGTWKYHNHLNPTQYGSVIVQ